MWDFRKSTFPSPKDFRSFEIPRGREVLFNFCHTPGYGTSILRREHSRKSTGSFPEQQRVLKPREVSKAKVLMESMVSYMICVLYAKLDLIWIIKFEGQKWKCIDSLAPRPSLGWALRYLFCLFQSEALLEEFITYIKVTSLIYY